MARKVFISFLGTTNYSPTNYYYQSLENKIDNVRFIQEASVRLFCNDWTANDKIFILVTKDSKEKNWFDNGHLDRETKQKILSEGLNTRLKNLNLKTEYNYVEIPKGNNEEEIWEIFKKIFDNIEPNDKIWFDITHSFRFLPMLNMVLINYAKFLKNISLEKITYGNYEGRDKEKNNSLIVDITSLSELQDWTSAASAFIEYGKTDKIVNKLDSKHQSDKLAIVLKNIELNFSTARGLKILSDNYTSILKQFDKLIGNDYLPLEPILKHIKSKIEKFKDNKSSDIKIQIENTFNAVDWCIQHKFIQQGFTLLQEGIISILLSQEKLDYSNKKYRELIGSIFKIYSKNIPFEEWHKNAKEQKDITEKFLKNDLIHKLSNDYSELTNYRNDLNHAGFLENAMGSGKFEDKLCKLYKNTLETIYNYYNLTINN